MTSFARNTRRHAICARSRVCFIAHLLVRELASCVRRLRPDFRRAATCKIVCGSSENSLLTRTRARARARAHVAADVVTQISNDRASARAEQSSLNSSRVQAERKTRQKKERANASCLLNG